MFENDNFNKMNDDNYGSVEDFQLDDEIENTQNESQESMEPYPSLDINLTEPYFNVHDLIQSGLKDEVINIYQYLETRNADSVNKENIKFDFPPEMTYEKDEENEYKNQVFNIMVSFQNYLCKIKYLSINRSDKQESIVKFPLIYNSTIRKDKVKKDRLEVIGLAGIHSLVAHGQLETAVEKCLETMKNEPSNISILNLLSFLYNELGDVENSLKFKLSAVLLSKNDPILLHYIGMLLIKNGYVEQGIASLGNSIRLIPRYIPSFWEICCQLFIKKSYTRLLYIALHFLKNPINELFEDNLNLVKSVIEVLKNNGGRRTLILLETFLTKSYPCIDNELFLTFCQLMVSFKMQKELFNSFFLILCLPKPFFDEIKLNKADSNSIPNIDYLDEITIFYFSISLIYSYPQSNFIKPLLQFIKNLQNGQNFVVDIINALCANNSLEKALEADFVTDECLSQNNNIRINVIVYYFQTNQILKAYECSSRITLLSNPYYLYFLSGIFSIILNLQDHILSYFLLFYQELHLDKIYKEEIRQILFSLFEKYPKIIDRETKELSQSLFISSLIFYFDSDEMENRGIVFLDYVKHVKQVLETLVFMGYSFSKSFLTSIDMGTRNFIKESNIYLKNINYEIKFLLISIMIKFKEYSDSYGVLCDLLLTHNPYLILENPAFLNLFAFIILRKNKYEDKRFKRILNSLEHGDRYEYNLLKSFLSSFRILWKYKEKSFFKACLKAGDQPLPFLMNASNLFNCAFSKGVSNNCPITIQAFVFIMIYFQKSGRYESLEACYNVGKFFHSLGYFSYAENFYRRCLSLEPSENNYIKKMAAFNLALIYDSNNRNLANTILRKYLQF